MQSNHHITDAIDSYQKGILSLGKAAKLAGMSLGMFMEQLSASEIPVVDYSPDELDDELKNIG